MADAPRPCAADARGSGQRGSTLGLRLALAFLGVALAAVALLAVLAAVFSAVDVSSLGEPAARASWPARSRSRRRGSWNADRGWAGADLSPVIDLAAHSGVQLQVRDDGRSPGRGHQRLRGAPGTPVKRARRWSRGAGWARCRSA